MARSKTVSEGVRISAKNLGAFALPTACDRCLWLAMQMEHKLPYSIFPGIFSSIDGYTKQALDDHFKRFGKCPDWLAPLGDFVESVPVPHYTKFSILDTPSGVTLRGTPDAILKDRQGSYTIIDFKTARYSAGQDTLLPMYMVQLNAYGRIGIERGYGPLSKLALVYMEPSTTSDVFNQDGVHITGGFRLGFQAQIKELAYVPERLDPLLQRVSLLAKASLPPESITCLDCSKLTKLLKLTATNE